MIRRVVFTGANSAVGRAILRVAAQEPLPVGLVPAVRSERARASLGARGGDAVIIAYDDATTLNAAFTGASAVIHLAGTLIEHGDSTYESANVQTARAVADAAERTGVGKVVL